MEKINKFYLSGKTFIVFKILSLISCLACVVNSLIAKEYRNAMLTLILLALIDQLLNSYKNNEPNVQKALLSSIFTFFIVGYAEIFFDQNSGTTYSLVTMIVSAISFILLVFSFICHLFQQSDHLGKSISVVTNQLIGLAVIVTIAYDIYLIVNHDYYIDTFLWSLTFISTLTLMICIETRVGEYKKIRLENIKNKTWNEETRKKAKELFKI